MKGERSIGVLTKLDNLHSTTDKKRVADVLDNKTKPLTLGISLTVHSLSLLLSSQSQSRVAVNVTERE